MSVMFQCFYNCEHLLVVDFIVHFRQVELPAVECNWVDMTVFSHLGYHCSYGEVGCVCLEDGWQIRVEILEDWCGGECCPEFVECCLCFSSPVKAGNTLFP